MDFKKAAISFSDNGIIYLYLIILIILCFVDVCYGAVFISFSSILSHNVLSLQIIQIRFVEMLQALLAGAVLSLCGGVLQKILKNPLADPFILGISSGGSCFSAIFVILNLSVFMGFNDFETWFPVQSFVSVVGCLFSTLLIFYLRSKIKSQHEEYSYLIIGVILNSFFSALLLITISIADLSQLGQIHSWLIGALQPVSFFQLLCLFVICIPCVILLINQSNQLNYLLLDDTFCKSLGIQSESLRKKLIFLICILISIVVSISGSIGFIGLIVPHYVRRLYKLDPKNELKLIMICGSGILVISDLFSRNLLPPSQLPIGIFTAFIGAPALAMILMRNSSK
jgi:iron complex transport system permease protein